MEKTYTYDAQNITKGGIDQMRFELGDTMVEGGSETCLLCDEEYRAILENAKTWTNAKISCLKAIVMKLSYEVDYKVDKMSLTFSKRYEQLKVMLLELEKKSQVPTFTQKIGDADEKEHYFYLGMQENPRGR